uniref:rRNA adenine N(6)-methyltransferase n=1 Tax=Ciona intestinalis TaxID=7719 RepID=F6SN27_CIOIN|nr:dimethyladenosine transferase 1, mitochondrial-like [Ciona intestinalis]|eukprot:XP_002130387.1 dimethyladenosine transferase 1, mitochondrial-like [Ciona intestinalis]
MKISHRLLNKFRPKLQLNHDLPTQAIPPMPTSSELLKMYNVRARKQLSQNFLLDPLITNRFVLCGAKDLAGHHVCEVGPGPGPITRSILQRKPERLTVVEKDHRFLPMLKYVADVSNDRMTIVHGDILKYDLSQCFPQELAKDWHKASPPFIVFGNLPFNVSLPLIFKWFEQISRKDGMFKLGRIPLVLTFQREVVERFLAQTGDKQRCRLSVSAQNFCDIDYKFIIAGGSFVPPPKVEVGVVKIVPKKTFDINLPFKKIDYVVKHTMHRKSKYCKHSVKTMFPPKRSDLVDEIFRKSGVDPLTRSNELENLHFRDLCYAYEEIADRIPNLRKVDTYGENEWSKTYFDANGNAKDVLFETAEKNGNSKIEIPTFEGIFETTSLK